jgi:integrase
VASLTKRPRNKNKPWTVQWYEGTGKRREAAFHTNREAKDFKIKLEHDQREGTFVDPRLGREPFCDAARRWLAGLAVAPEKRRAYQSVLMNHVLPALGDRALQQVAQDREGAAQLLNQHLVELSRQRREIARLVITGTLNEAVRAARIPRHRLDGIRLVSNGRAPDRSDFVFPPLSQIEALAAGLRPDLRLTIWLMRGCGLRVSEALAVREDCFGERTLRVFEQVQPDGRGTVALKHRRPGESREMPAPAYLLEAVGKHVSEHGTRDGYLLAGTRVPYVQHRGYLKSFTRAAQLAGITEGFTPHSLRHVFASALLARGVPITDLAEWLGHRSIEVTYRIYGHLVPSAWGRAQEALDAEYLAWSNTG